MRATDLNKQQTLDADPKSVQQINFARNLARDGKENTTIFFINEKTRETKLDFSNETIKVLQFYFILINSNVKTTQQKALDVKLSNSQLSILKSGIQNGTEVTLNLSSNVIGIFHGEIDFRHKLL